MAVLPEHILAEPRSRVSRIQHQEINKDGGQSDLRVPDPPPPPRGTFLAGGPGPRTALPLLPHRLPGFPRRCLRFFPASVAPGPAGTPRPPARTAEPVASLWNRTQ